MDTLRNAGNQAKQAIERTINTNIEYYDEYNFKIIALILIIFILFSVLVWVFNTLNLKGRACKKLDNIYMNTDYKTKSFLTTNGKVKGEAKEVNNIKNFFDNENKSLVKNYYVKTAYNCCCGDGYKNNFVNICALEKCIELGARCLDFEIYSYYGEPIVAASTANNNSIKETYNYLKLSDVFNVLHNRVFDEQYTSSANDPIFLHFRIMSQNKIIYDKMAKYINDYLDKGQNYILDNKKYNYKNPDQNIFLQGHIADDNFRQKMIIMVNTLHVSVLDNSKLSEYVNIRSGSNAMKLLRYEQVVASGSNNPLLIDETHRSIVMVLPNWTNEIVNYDPLLPIENGCQFVGMKFQNLDPNLKGYLKYFKDSGGFSYVLKPNHLRKDLIEEEPIPQDNPLNPKKDYDI